jgi:hypothetical protein
MKFDNREQAIITTPDILVHETLVITKGFLYKEVTWIDLASFLWRK